MRIFISFDFDRTLADYSKAHGNAILGGIYEVFDKKFQVNWFDLHSSGLTDLQIITDLVHNHGISYHTIFKRMNNCVYTITDIFNKYLSIYPVELLDKADEIIEDLYKRDNVIIGLSTGNIRSISLEKIYYTGIDQFFKFGSFGDEVFNRYQLLRKTKNRLIQNFHFSSYDIAMHVGDSTLDVLSAKKAGFIPIGVATGNYSKEKLREAGATFVFNNLKEFNNSFDAMLDGIKKMQKGLSLSYKY